MSQLKFWCIATEFNVKYLLPVSIDRFWQANFCFSSDHYM